MLRRRSEARTSERQRSSENYLGHLPASISHWFGAVCRPSDFPFLFFRSNTSGCHNIANSPM
jgi:hypothetical protein